VSPRSGLNRDAVVREAAALADAEGISALTIARLAARLSVRPPSLYNHVSGIEALHRELALLGLGELRDRLGRAAVGRAGEDAVVTLADAYRAFGRERPGLYAATQWAPNPTDPLWLAMARDAVDIVVAALRAFDLDGDAALHAVRGLRSLLHGFVALETTGGFGLPLDQDESFRRLVRTYLAGLRTLAEREHANTSVDTAHRGLGRQIAPHEDG